MAAGLTVGLVGPGYLTLTMRGISDLDGGLLGMPATGFYIDEAPLSAFASIALVEYVEIRRTFRWAGRQQNDASALPCEGRDWKREGQRTAAEVDEAVMPIERSGGVVFCIDNQCEDAHARLH